MHIEVFKYIIQVECYKFQIYKQIILELDLESVFLPIMVKRSYNCELKISLSLKIIESNKHNLDSNDMNLVINDIHKVMNIIGLELRSKEVDNSISFIKLGY